jgi:ADP-heptose:LPS heptosyltransferase
LICTSAAKIQGLDSNKDWRDVRWFKLVNELQKIGYFVIQVGSKSDNQIPNVNLKFLDKPLPNVADLVDKCSLWVSVDTFFHHFASAIKPEVGICLTPFYNDHAKHLGVTYIEKDCGKDFSERRWWLDSQQPERKECMDLIQLQDVLNNI